MAEMSEPIERALRKLSMTAIFPAAWMRSMSRELSASYEGGSEACRESHRCGLVSS